MADIFENLTRNYPEGLTLREHLTHYLQGNRHSRFMFAQHGLQATFAGDDLVALKCGTAIEVLECVYTDLTAMLDQVDLETGIKLDD